ncbi:MAG TPA: efflux RND transporter periplasmic adaptor subunit [Albitalea sp.]
MGAGGYWLGTRAPVHDSATTSAAPGKSAAPAERKVLYYRNPMGLPDTSPTPKKDQMGMDYIPVYEDEETNGGPAGSNQIRISTEKIQKLGVRVEPVSLRTLGKTVRAAGRVEPDERKTYAISPKFEGYVERLHVNVTGQPVGRGQPLFEVYSPELVSAQREYLIALEGVKAMRESGGDAAGGMKQLADSALARLRNWDLSTEQINALVNSGESRRTITFRSPVSGIVTEKKALQGMRFMPGEMLYQVTDLSSIWVLADVFEHDIGLIKKGAKASVAVNAYPGKAFTGTITYVYPTLKEETRTIPVRIELANPGQLLKPGMFAQIDTAVGGKGQVLTVPDSAVIDTGTRQIVLVQAAEGRFEPREVQLGARSESHIEVREGVKEGEQVVVSANFLIDAESNLKAAIGGFGTAAAPAASAPAAGSAPVGHKATGTVDGIDAKAGTLSLNHGPVASLNWPAMTMEFKVANDSLLKGLKPGAAVSFEFVERQAGEWVVTAIKPTSGHSGH